MQHKSVLLGSAVMLLSTVSFSGMHACIRYLSEDLHPFEIAFFRNLFGLIALTPFIYKAGKSILKTNHLNLHMIRAGFNMVAMLFFFYALSITPLALVIGVGGTLGQFCIATAFSYADATVVLPIDFAKIVWGAIFGYVFFSEAVDLLTWVGAVVVFSGACYLAWRERQLEVALRAN